MKKHKKQKKNKQKNISNKNGPKRNEQSKKRKVNEYNYEYKSIDSPKNVEYLYEWVWIFHKANEWKKKKKLTN